MALFSRKPAEAPAKTDPLDAVVVNFEQPTTGGAVSAVPWTVRDAVEGTQIFGATGSGKTSGSGRAIAIGMLRQGFGGLVLTAKGDEVDQWTEYMRDAGRTDKLKIIRPASTGGFDFLDHEYRYFKNQPGSPYALNLVSIFSSAMRGGGEGREQGNVDPYWQDAVQQLLTNAITLSAIAHDRVTLQDIVDIIRTAPQTPQEARATNWPNSSLCLEWIHLADRKGLPAATRRELLETVRYWLLEFANLHDRTRSIVVNSFTSKATPLLRDPLFQLFSKPDAFTPADTHRGEVVILDMPVKTFGDAGCFAQKLIKTVWQRATERRVSELHDPEKKHVPVFLWADESQYFLTGNDMHFQQTARSSLAATVYLTQNISNYYAMIGTQNPQAVTDSLLGNLQTKIFHANGDPATNEWAERVITRELQSLRGMGPGGATLSENYHPIVPAITFTGLAKGGTSYERRVEAIVFQTRLWSHPDGRPRNYLRATFRQPLKG